MLNRRWPMENRRYIRRGKPLPADASESVPEKEIPQKVKGIPLPNVAEGYLPDYNTSDRFNFPSVLGFLKNIKLEEIILIGLIILLIDGGIEDEFLLIMLVYILMF